MALNFNRIVFLVFFSFFVHSSTAQHHMFSYGKGLFDGRFGVNIGGTNYITDSELVFSKSKPGLSVGLTGTAQFSDNFELLVEMTYSRNFVSFVGRKDMESPREDIKFKLENFNVPIILKYRVYNSPNEDWHFGLLAGPSLSLFYNYKPVEEGESQYLLDPYNIKAEYMAFDESRGKIAFNAFASFGASIEFRHFMLNGRYNIGITDPYRNANLTSQYVDITGKDSFYQLSLTYFFGEE